MAIGALARRHGVHSCQYEAGGGVVEAGKIDAQPVVRRMAVLASDRELSRNVVGIGGTGKVRLVAGIARRRHSLELAVCPTFVAGIAVHRSVCSG